MDYKGHMLGYWGRNIVKKYGGVLLALSEDRYDLETSCAVGSQLFQEYFSITLPLDSSVLSHYLLSTILPPPKKKKKTTFIRWKGHSLSAYSAYKYQ